MISKSLFVRSLTCTNLLATSLPFPRAFTGQNAMGTASQPPTAFVLDFDGTITVKDTIGVLGKLGVEWQRQRGADMKRSWDEIVKAYGRDFERHVGGYKPAKDGRRTLEVEIQYLRGLREIEENSFGRVGKSGLFKGMGPEDWELAGRMAEEKGDVVLRRGFRDFVEKLKREEMVWGIVSVNFSGSFIRGVVGPSPGPESEDVELLANESDEDGVLVGRGDKFGRVIATSDAKLAYMKDLLKMWKDRTSLESPRVVYIGDSETDLECLTDQEVTGIVMSEDGKSSLLQTMQRIGVDAVPIESYGQNEFSERRIYWARDFNEVLYSPLLAQR